jgi:cytochrome c-type biogenesis protein
MLDVSLATALVGGLISFLSPCVLPLVPPYLSFLAGTTFDRLEAGDDAGVRRRALLAALLFVAGFTTVFVALGATASASARSCGSTSMCSARLAGLAIIVMGLHFLGAFRIGLLYREARFQVARPVGLWGAYAMGLAFAFGWTPCIGPVLAAILAVAGSEANVAKGAGAARRLLAWPRHPFLIAAFAMKRSSRAIGRVPLPLRPGGAGHGALLVLTGVAFLTGWITTGVRSGSWRRFPRWGGWGIRALYTPRTRYVLRSGFLIGALEDCFDKGGRELFDDLLEPIREVLSPDQGLARRRSMRRIMARRTKAAAFAGMALVVASEATTAADPGQRPFRPRT